MMNTKGLVLGIVIFMFTAVSSNAGIKLVLNSEQIGRIYHGIYNTLRIEGGVLDSFENKTVRILKKEPNNVCFQILKKELKQLRVYLKDQNGEPVTILLPIQPAIRFPLPSLFFCSKLLSLSQNCGLTDLSNSMIVRNPFGVLENQSVFNYTVKEYYMSVYRNRTLISESDFRKHALSFGGENIRKILRDIKTNDVVEFSQILIEDKFGNEYKIPSFVIRLGSQGWTGF